MDRTVRILEVSVAVIGAICGAVALVVALGERNRADMQTKMSVMPLFYVDSSKADEGKTYIKSSFNRGLGPAVIKWYGVTFDGKVLRHWEDLYTALGATSGMMSVGMLWPEVAQQPGADGNVVLLKETDPKTARLLWTNRKKINVQVCYCSIVGICQMAYEFKSDQEPLDDCKFEKTYEAKFIIPPFMDK